MSDTTLPVTDADSVKRDVAFDETGGVYTPKTYALQSGTWTVAVSGTVTVSGTVAATQSGTWNIGTVTPGTGATNLGKAVDSAAGASDVGVAALAVRDNALSNMSIAEGDYGRLHTNNRGALWVQPTASYAGGAQSSRKISAASTNATSVATSTANLLSVVAMNNHAENIAYLKIYDKASSPTVGTDTPLFTYALAPNGGGVAIAFPTGAALANGLAYAITGGMADNDTTAVAASQVTVNLTYQWSS
jgi:hypothetical protein